MRATISHAQALRALAFVVVVGAIAGCSDSRTPRTRPEPVRSGQQVPATVPSHDDAGAERDAGKARKPPSRELSAEEKSSPSRLTAIALEEMLKGSARGKVESTSRQPDNG
jgi:hypothetical protein